MNKKTQAVYLFFWGLFCTLRSEILHQTLTEMKKIAVFTSGGDAPGMNACIRAVVRGALYHGLEPYGIYRGYNGMIAGDIEKMDSHKVSNILQLGGTILKSARSKEFMTKEGRQKAYGNLQELGIEGLVAIGGNGTFTGAKKFHEEFGIPTVGVPGTIDNDLYGTDATLGFDTAVNTSIDAIDKIRDTAGSHDRIFFVEVMGRDAGYLAIRSGIGGGAEMVLIPEKKQTIEDVISKIKEGHERAKTSSIIVVAEGDQIGDANSVAHRVQQNLQEMDIRVTTLGHIQRGGSPTAMDRIRGSRMGLAAVEALMAGKTDIMVGIKNYKIAYTSFEETITKKKPFQQDMLRMVEILSI